MRRLLLLVALLTLACPAWAQFPSPTFATAIVQGAINTGTLNVASTADLNGGGALIGTFAGPTQLSNVQPTITATTTANLPTQGTPGTLYWVTDCRNANEASGHGTGCYYHANASGTPIADTTPPAGTVATIGGQGLSWGGATANQGSGPNLLTCTGTITPGDALTVNAGGTCIDSGVVPSGGTGGGGTVANCSTAGLPAYYPATGTSVSCPTGVLSSLWGENASGVLTAFTTLPSGLTAPSWTLSNANLTGTAAAIVLNMSGALTLATSTTSTAYFNCPAGSAPTSPANNNVWCTSAGMFDRFGGVTVGPFIGLAQLSGTTGISYNSSTGAITCPLCLLGSSGGTLTPTAPIVISGTGISLGTTIGFAEYFWDTNTTVTAQTIPIPETWPTATGTIDSVTAHVNGTSSPQFTISLAINGSAISGTCGSGIVVNSSTDATTSCGSAAITTGQKLTMATSAIGGSPNNSLVQINFHRSNP